MAFEPGAGGGKPCLTDGHPASSRIGENPTYGFLGGPVETRRAGVVDHSLLDGAPLAYPTLGLPTVKNGQRDATGSLRTISDDE
jgi:hypothetical protein